MHSDTILRVDDLTPDESAAVAHAYLTALEDETICDPFEGALAVLLATRPQLPATVAAVELELLLATLPATLQATSGAHLAACA